jgi:hypothetical protein
MPTDGTTRRITSMRKTMIICVAMLSAALAFAAVASAGKNNKTAKKLAAQQCKAEKKADKAAFKATYGKRAMRTCKKGEKSEIKGEIRNASQECRAEREADRDLFKETYGKNKNGKNAFGKCVSSKVKEDVAEEIEAFKNAAKECKAEREDVGKEAFKEEYGSNKNKRNALGKCVSSKVKDAEEEPEEEPVEVS